MIVEEALSELTETEKRIVTEFMKTKLPAKELAKKLNVSVRTVYKALYKYRRALKKRGIDVRNLYLLSSRNSKSKAKPAPKPEVSEQQNQVQSIEGMSVDIAWLRSEIKKIVMEYVQELGSVRAQANDTQEKTLALMQRMIALLEEINKNLIALNRALERSRVMVRRAKPQSVRLEIPLDSSLPTFVQGNPWIEVLASRSE